MQRGREARGGDRQVPYREDGPPLAYLFDPIPLPAGSKRKRTSGARRPSGGSRARSAVRPAPPPCAAAREHGPSRRGEPPAAAGLDRAAARSGRTCAAPLCKSWCVRALHVGCVHPDMLHRARGA